MGMVRVAQNAMATRFEIVLHGPREAALRAAGEEALQEVAQLEEQLSLFRPSSEIAHLNARAAREPVRVSPPVFQLLGHAKKLHEETGGAFDITIAPLVRCWGFMQGTGQIPEPAALEEARSRVGMHLLVFDPENYTIQFSRPGVMLDLGAIGKGYAIERAAALLRDAGVESALLHGGTSTIYAIGHPPDAEAWKIAIEGPPGQGTPGESLATAQIKDEALSVSAIWGKWFKAGGKSLGHVLDPRTGHPAGPTVLAALATASATESDALSTGLLILGESGQERIRALRSQIRTLLVVESPVGLRLCPGGWPE
jgi:thiamine biosynthesis lipoprotein